jgi:hypothetical protein
MKMTILFTTNFDLSISFPLMGKISGAKNGFGLRWNRLTVTENG